MTIPLHNLWFIGCLVLTLAILLTLAPVVYAFLKQIKLEAPNAWFKQSEAFTDQQARLRDHEVRIQGTLLYWKNKAAAHKRLHLSRVIWSLVSGVSIPVLIQFYDRQEVWAVVFMTSWTSWTGVIVAFAHTFKSEQQFTGFRQCESDYYDLARTLLDFPEDTKEGREKQVDDFFRKVALVHESVFFSVARLNKNRLLRRLSTTFAKKSMPSRPRNRSCPTYRLAHLPSSLVAHLAVAPKSCTGYVIGPTRRPGCNSAVV